MRLITRRFQYEIFPSPIQQRYLAQIFGSVRMVYNEFLMMNSALRSSGKPRLIQSEMQELIPGLKEVYPYLKKTPSQSIQVATHDLDIAYQNAKKPNIKGKKAGQPKLKRRGGKDSFQLPQPRIEEFSGQTCIFIPNYKTWIPICQHREFPTSAKIGAGTISKTKTGRYFISVVVTFEDSRELKSESSEMLGVDINIHEFVCSDGTRIETPKLLKTLESRKRRIQKAMTRKEDAAIKLLGFSRQELSKKSKQEQKKIWKQVRSLRSKNYEKDRIALTKVHEKIKNRKKDLLHKTALKLFRKNHAVALETLNVKGMMKNRKLSRSIAARSWGEFIQIMKIYAVQYSKDLHFVGQWFPSSKQCSGCKTKNDSLTLKDREWTCNSCGIHHDRDLNAAINIKHEGGSYPVYKPVESLKKLRRPNGQQTNLDSEKQESSRFEVSKATSKSA